MTLNQGKLILIPTPIDEESSWDNHTLSFIEKEINFYGENRIVVVGEELKTLRRYWLRSGLPRTFVEKFLILNEHNSTESSFAILAELKKGKVLFLTSEGGLPAFFDPGQGLVDLCHRQAIQVTSSPFSNSIALAIALSGFPHNRVMIEGFLPVKDKEERIKALSQILKNRYPSLILDTPYRLQRILSELEVALKSLKQEQREIFIALNLNREGEQVKRGKVAILNQLISREEKKEFVLMIGPWEGEKSGK